MKKHKKFNLLVGVLLVLVVAVGGAFWYFSHQGATDLLANPQVETTTTMGTTVTVTNYTPGVQESVLKNALKIAEDYNTWTTVNQKGSLVDEINANSGTGTPVKVPDQLFTLIQDAYNLSDQHTGYDVTVGPLTQLWHIGFPDAKLPSQSEIESVLPLINYQYMQLNAQNHTVYLTKKGAQLDLGSITKGYTCKLMTDYLKEHGVKDGVVDLGSSSLYMIGHSPRGNHLPWNVGVKDPNNPSGVNIGVLSAENQFISTSGIYERYLKVNGKTYSHILNPTTGYPFDNDIQSVSLLGSDDPTFGDGVTTTIFALGTKKGYDYVMAHHLQAIFIDKNNKVYITPGLKKIFTLNTASKYHITNISTLKGNG